MSNPIAQMACNEINTQINKNGFINTAEMIFDEFAKRVAWHMFQAELKRKNNG